MSVFELGHYSPDVYTGDAAVDAAAFAHALSVVGDYGTIITEPGRQLLLTSIIPITRPCLLYTSPSPRDATLSRMPSSA